jgi:hypothetical protein
LGRLRPTGGYASRTPEGPKPRQNAGNQRRKYSKTASSNAAKVCQSLGGPLARLSQMIFVLEHTEHGAGR